MKRKENKVQSDSVIASLKGSNKLCCYKQMLLQVKAKYFRTKCSPARVLQQLNVKDMTYSKLELQLKLRNKIYSSTNVNFHAGLL